MTPLLTLLLIGLIAALIGTAASATGYGGFLLPAALVALVGMSPQPAVLHGLVAALGPGVMAIVLHLRKGRRREAWPLAGWLSLGTIPGLVLARLVAGLVDPVGLRLVLGVVVLAAAVLIGANQRIRRSHHDASGPRPRCLTPAVAVSAGAVGGAATIFAGVGGPLVTMPALLVLGVPVTTALVASMINALLATVSGIVALAPGTPLDPGILLVATAALALGTVLGVGLHHRIRPSRLVTPVAVVSGLSALWLLGTAVAAFAG